MVKEYKLIIGKGFVQAQISQLYKQELNLRKCTTFWWKDTKDGARGNLIEIAINDCQGCMQKPISRKPADTQRAHIAVVV